MWPLSSLENDQCDGGTKFCFLSNLSRFKLCSFEKPRSSPFMLVNHLFLFCCVSVFTVMISLKLDLAVQEYFCSIETRAIIE